MARATTSSKSRAKPAARKAPDRGHPPKDDIPLLEWISAGIGLVLALAAIGFTAWDAVFGVEGPPSIEVRLLAVTPTPHGFVAEVEAVNHGGAPAAQVAVEGVLDGAAGPETAEVTFDYVPEGSRTTGGLIFGHDPREGRLVLRAKGFVDAS